MFRKAVVEQGFKYDRFREDFINSHTFHDAADADSRNDHKVNLGRIGSLLSTRDDLVRKYCNTSLDPGEFLSCMKEFMLEVPRTKPRLINLECYLSDRTLQVITDAANDIPLFKRVVSMSDMDCLFNRCVPTNGEPLVANSNEVLSYFFSRLNYHGLISNKYQTVLGEARLVMRSTGDRALSQTDISSALRNFESSDKPITSRVERWVVLVSGDRDAIARSVAALGKEVTDFTLFRAAEIYKAELVLRVKKRETSLQILERLSKLEGVDIESIE